MAARPRRPKTALEKRIQAVASDKEINILLLGQTGIGKTTFINAFANYFLYDTMEEAMDKEMQVLIPDSFSFTDPDTFEEKTIKIGNDTDREDTTENGQSNSAQCRSYVFSIGNRNLRLIDTPGLGDTRGSEQDNKNFFEILSYISHYEHLNGVCIFLKPNEERLTIVFRLCIGEILRYLHKQVCENMIFVFTNARSTFFMPGSSQKILQGLLKEYQEKSDIEIPFSKENTFLVDNEAFRGLALHERGIKVNEEQMESFKKSWKHSLKEYQHIFTYVSQRPLHAVAGTLSLNAVEQLIRRLTRPIAEILRLIQENIQLATNYQREQDKHKNNTSQGLVQYAIQIQPFTKPVLICINKKCSRRPGSNNDEQKISHNLCQEESYLDGVVQEAISDPRIARLKIIDSQTEKCQKCGCTWKNHMNITFELHRHTIAHKFDSENKNQQSAMEYIEKHRQALETEKTKIEDTYKNLSKFLQVKALSPLNDDIISYFKLFIQEEQMKQQDGARSTDIIDGLERMKKDYEDDMATFHKKLSNEKGNCNTTSIESLDENFKLVGDLYRLPINGQTLRELVNTLQHNESRTIRQKEILIDLTEKTAESAMKRTLVSERF